jgi:hypothetical protein
MVVGLNFMDGRGRYRSFVKTFNDERHLDNYINKMIDFGWKLIGVYKEEEK